MNPFIYNLDFVKEQSSKELFNVVSLFAGGGGSSTGYRLAGGKVLAINEFIPAAQDAYAINYPETYIFKQDIRDLTGQMVLNQIGFKKGELDILDGSPPCSSFSMAGLREKGWGVEKKYSDSSQRTDDLFFEFARILKEVQPKVFICENVKGITMGEASNLLGSEQINIFGEEKNTIFHTLVDCGYNVRYKVLNAKNFLVPQSRERTIFIGVRKDIKKQITFPITKNEQITIGEALPWIKRISAKKKCFNETELRTIEKHEVCSTISSDGLFASRRHFIELDNEFKNLSKEQERVYELQLSGESMKACGDRIGERISGMTRIKLDENKPCSTVLTAPELWHPFEKRTLSIGELKIICSFPYDYYCGNTFSNKWERLGRAVPPLMMKSVADHVYKTILS
jgi:DNA (cytosine-5)-methyltransferase 1